MRNNNKRPNINRKSDLERQSKQYNQEFARANAAIRNQNPYDQEFAVENEGTLKNTRNANTRGFRQRDVMNLECSNDNEFKELKRKKDNVEFAKDNDLNNLKQNKNNKVEFANDNNFDDCDDCCDRCNEDECDCE